MKNNAENTFVDLYNLSPDLSQCPPGNVESRLVYFAKLLVSTYYSPGNVYSFPEAVIEILFISKPNNLKILACNFPKDSSCLWKSEFMLNPGVPQRKLLAAIEELTGCESLSTPKCDG